MTDRELMQQALEALEKVNASPHLEDWQGAFDDEVKALRERLARQEQELVIDCPRCGHCCPQPAQQPLTDEQVWACLPPDPDNLAFARAIEAAHGIKEQP